ncbi:energy-coupling factor transporter ATPase [Tardisphaera miroshnichenkoae]
MKAIEVKELWWRYPSYEGLENDYVLKGISFSVDQGEFFAVVGPSGAGKTTLCYALTGIIPTIFKIPQEQLPSYMKGQVRVMGEDPSHRRRARVGLLLQDPENQFLRMDLLHEVSFGMQMMGLPQEEIEKRAKEALEVVGLGSLWHIADKVHPSELSGGQKQRVAIASFLAMAPDVLILDEPTSDLDPAGKLSVIQAIDEVHREHDLTLFLVEHNPDVVLKFADRVLVLDEGKPVMVGSTAEVYSKVDELNKHGIYLPEVSRMAWAAGITYRGRVPFTVEEMERALSGAKLKPELLPMGEADGDELAVEVSGLNFWYEDGTHALRGIDLNVPKGAFAALIGQNGSGKTTLARVVAGIYKKYEGNVCVMGGDLSDKRVRGLIHGLVGYVFQNPDNQIFTRSVHDEVAYGLRNMGLEEEELEERIRQSLSEVGLLDKIDEDPMFLGKGEKRRLGLASVMAMRPPIIIVDEPTTGQDFRMSQDIMRLLALLNSRGTTVISITHDMTLVAEYAKQVIAMAGGRVIYSGNTRDFFSDPANVSRAGVMAPGSVQLSYAMRKQNPDFPLLMNVAEWIAALESNKVLEGESELNKV